MKYAVYHRQRKQSEGKCMGFGLGTTHIGGSPWQWKNRAELRRCQETWQMYYNGSAQWTWSLTILPDTCFTLVCKSLKYYQLMHSCIESLLVSICNVKSMSNSCIWQTCTKCQYSRMINNGDEEENYSLSPTIKGVTCMTGMSITKGIVKQSRNYFLLP